MDGFSTVDDIGSDEFDDLEEIEFDRSTAEALYREGMYTTDPARWERIKNEIPFDDLVSDLIGTHSTVISCPFHGRDSKPSFNLYRRTNDAYCFGCPDGERYYDSVRFVAARFQISRKDALKWLEEKYGLPPMDDIAVEQEEYEPPTEVVATFADVATTYKEYVQFVLRDARTNQTELRKLAMMAEAYSYVFFANEPDRNGQNGNVLPLAQILGTERMNALLNDKANR